MTTRTAADLLLAAMDLFGATLGQVETDADWWRPTPCADWDVRELVNHVVVENLWVPPLFEGRAIEEVGDALDGDQLGDDARAAWSAASAAARVAIGAPGAMERTVQLSFGRTPAHEYAMQLFADHLVHAWDLGAALGHPPELPADLVAACAAWFEDEERGYREAGVIGPRPQLPDAVEGVEGADGTTTLLAMFGRTASWMP
ncbi:TIGR03086 family metal-binding protein [Spongisporangium articulatum]|uniref:TIGR03086 family metal-binding protein n=1 Tax=Spongisporangium articulatum TaxID=3362603 RepID=A0ABW8ANX4_9ACTN